MDSSEIPTSKERKPKTPTEASRDFLKGFFNPKTGRGMIIPAVAFGASGVVGTIHGDVVVSLAAGAASAMYAAIGIKNATSNRK